MGKKNTITKDYCYYSRRCHGRNSGEDSRFVETMHTDAR